jgi:hypothetical protein
LHYHRKTMACSNGKNKKQTNVISLNEEKDISKQIQALRSEMMSIIHQQQQCAQWNPEGETTSTYPKSTSAATNNIINISNNVKNMTTNITTTNNNNSIVINAFGSECVDHITDNFLDQCVRRRDKGLVELIEKIHFDCPENQNMRVKNVKLPFIQCHNGQKWVYDKKDRVLNHLVDKGHGMMQEHLDDNDDRIRENMSQTMYDCIVEWMEKIHDRDKNTLESVLTDIYLLILNSSSNEDG